jgi:hypothetical protein
VCQPLDKARQGWANPCLNILVGTTWTANSGVQFLGVWDVEVPEGVIWGPKQGCFRNVNWALVPQLATIKLRTQR